ncbi:MAG: hypothetical protein ACU85U_19670 [Gammaproteobacteria bacterium]
MNPRNLVFSVLLAALGAVAMPVAADNHGGGAEFVPPDAFVWFSRKGIGAIIGGSAGGGRIHFMGDDHTFRMTGLKFGVVGGLGEAKMSGEVYGLSKLEDFAGTYKETTTGISAIVGSGGVWLENAKGVKMHLKAESTGVGVNFGVGTVEVKLGMVD